MDAPFFPGFRSARFAVDGLHLHAVIGGKGPPLLLLHGAPQSHVMWRKVAPALAERFTVVAADLRGYGASDKPATGDYSKRRMAADAVAIMGELGFSRFSVAGHDRGARATRRLTKDHPDKIERAAILDIVPTAYIYGNLTKERARTFWHWFAFIQREPIPEALISPEAYVRYMLSRIGAEDSVAAAYLATNGNAAAFHAMCEDYRAGAGIDLEHDAADAQVKIACPLLVLWGAQSYNTGKGYDVAAIWREEARDVAFGSLDCGHFLPEEDPAGTLKALGEFF